MDSIELMRVFCDVAERGSMAGAARARGVSPATITKAVARLEQRYQVQLLRRTTRRVSLTDAGRVLLERSAGVLESMRDIDDELRERALFPGGRLSLTAPHDLLQIDLTALLGRFLQRYPDVGLDLQVTDEVLDLVEQGIDLAFRIGAVIQGDLIVRRLLPIRLVAAAAPAYWHQHGKPTHPQELHDHVQLACTPRGSAAQWVFAEDGQTFKLALHPRLVVTDHAPLAAMAAQGLGVIWAPRHLVGGYLERGELEPALAEFSPPDVWLYAAYTQRRYKSAALKALLEQLQVDTQHLNSKMLVER